MSDMKAGEKGLLIMISVLFTIVVVRIIHLSFTKNKMNVSSTKVTSFVP